MYENFDQNSSLTILPGNAPGSDKKKWIELFLSGFTFYKQTNNICNNIHKRRFLGWIRDFHPKSHIKEILPLKGSEYPSYAIVLIIVVSDLKL